MLKYTLHFDERQRHLMRVEFEFELTDEEMVLQIPHFRPGRYEPGNFMRNFIRWSLTSENGIARLHKRNRNSWTVEGQAGVKCTFAYDYYGNDFSAGSTFIDEDLIFLNFPNFAVFIPGTENESPEVFLNLPEHFDVTPMEVENVLRLENYDRLYDYPIFAAKKLHRYGYSVNGIDFRITTFPHPVPKPEHVIEHFKAFTEEQIEQFGAFPSKVYDFMFMLTPERSYHGVEHFAGTMVVLGPESDVWNTARYEELLGVSSHELYHTWNIKDVRPKELSPINWSGDNIFSTGYVAEGVTTYMGDLALSRSKVFNWKQFAATQEQNLQRHLDNDARTVRSVADSSKELWVDGYVLSSPERMTSIYAEGALNALMVDLYTWKASSWKHGIIHTMRELWNRYKLPNGYTPSDYENLCAEMSDEGVRRIFEDHTYGTEDYIPTLRSLLHEVGVDLVLEDNDLIVPRYLGFRARKVEGEFEVYRVEKGSVAQKAGMNVGITILRANGEKANERISDMLKYMRPGDEVEFEVRTPYDVRTIQMEASSERYFLKPVLVKNEHATTEQKARFELWCGLEFSE